jgi:hypothetical protein
MLCTSNPFAVLDALEARLIPPDPGPFVCGSSPAHTSAALTECRGRVNDELVERSAVRDVDRLQAPDLHRGSIGMMSTTSSPTSNARRTSTMPDVTIRTSEPTSSCAWSAQ